MIDTQRASLAEHSGIFRKQLSLFQGVALIVSGTIGAGILGIPYAVSQSGLGIGIFWIVGLGLLMMGINLLIGEVVARARMPLQLAGLAKKYLGTVGEMVVSAIVYSLTMGVLTVYLIGEGEGFSTLFGGSSFAWASAFFIAGTTLIFLGVRTIKTAELFLSAGVLSTILIIALSSIRHLSLDNVAHLNFARALFPYGVIMFALHGTTAVPEAYNLLRRKERTFKRAIIVSGSIVICAYVLFAIAVVGVTGSETTEIATVGLGRALGPLAAVIGTVFAVLAMGTGFLMAGLSLRDSMSWDFGVRPSLATVTVCGIPYLLYAFGMRNFIAAIELVGGVFMSIEMLLLVAIYLRARRLDHRMPRYSVRHSWSLLTLLILALTGGAVYSMVAIF